MIEERATCFIVNLGSKGFAIAFGQETKARARLVAEAWLQAKARAQ